jgi:hypothetical protein
MENQDFNKELLDYLYGEMEPSEKEAFERKLEVDLELKNEYEELVSVKKELENLKDKEVMEPFSAWGRSKISNQLQSGRRKRLIVFRPVTAIAASLVILMLVGFWTDFSLTVNSQGFYMGFSDQIELGTTDNLSEEDVQRLIETQLAQNNQKLAAQLAEARESYDDQLVAFGQELNRLKDGSAETSVSKDDIQELLRQTELSNTDLMKEYLRLTSNQQQQYFKEMLTQFNTFYRQQRENDMAVIQEHLLEINQQQALQKQETDQALARLFTRVSNN